MDAMDVLNGAKRSAATPPSLPHNLRVCAPDLKKLKRMPHLFTRVLELPLHADTPVSVLEFHDSFRFQVRLPGLHFGDVKVEVLEIVPGATKVLVRGVETHVDIPEVDFWRFRLPPTTVPENSVATCDRDLLSVVIPKTALSCKDETTNEPDETTNEPDETTNEPDETEDERMQREVLEDLESFGSPRRTRSSRRPSPSPSPSASPRDIDQEKLQEAVLEDLECFGSPRRRSCTQSLSFGQQQPHHDFFRSVGSWVGGFSVYVQ